MMNLDIQMKVIMLSFISGTFFSLEFNMFHNLILLEKMVLRILFNLFFSLVNACVFFILLYNINDGKIHIYIFCLLFLGFIFGNVFFKKKS